MLASLVQQRTLVKDKMHYGKSFAIIFLCNRHLLPDEHLGDAAGIPDDQEVLVDVRDVQIAAVLGRLGEVHLAPQNCGALVRLGEAEGGA